MQRAVVKVVSMFHVALRKAPGTLADVVRERLVDAIRRHGGNVRAAAEELGVSYRTAHRMVTGMGLRQTLHRVRRRKVATQAAAA